MPAGPGLPNGQHPARERATLPRFPRHIFFFFFLNSYFYPGWHPYGQAGWLSTTQVLKGSLLPESGKDEKEKKRESVELRSRGADAVLFVGMQQSSSLDPVLPTFMDPQLVLPSLIVSCHVGT